MKNFQFITLKKSSSLEEKRISDIWRDTIEKEYQFLTVILKELPSKIIESSLNLHIELGRGNSKKSLVLEYSDLGDKKYIEGANTFVFILNVGTIDFEYKFKLLFS